MKDLKLNVLAIIIINIVLIIGLIIMFSGCTTQRHEAVKYTVVYRDSAKIARLTDSVRVLNVKINEQIQNIINEKDVVKSLENSKVNEKITDFDTSGNITKIQERTIDYSKSTDSEKVFFYQYLYKKTSEERDSIQKVFIENEQIWQNKEIDYRYQLKQKTSAKSFWWLWLIIGAAGYAVGEFFVKKYLGFFLSWLK